MINHHRNIVRDRQLEEATKNSNKKRKITDCFKHSLNDQYIDALVQWVVMTKQPFTAASNPHFRKIIALLNSHLSTKVKDIGKEMMILGCIIR